MSENVNCPKCGSEYTYENPPLMVCTQCFHEWDPKELEEKKLNASKTFDANGNELKDGDDVIVIKDLPVKGASKPIKGGTKVKNIKIVDGDHDIDCKIDGFGKMGLKSEFVKKA